MYDKILNTPLKPSIQQESFFLFIYCINDNSAENVNRSRIFIAAQLKNYIHNIKDEIFSEDLEIKGTLMQIGKSANIFVFI